MIKKKYNFFSRLFHGLVLNNEIINKSAFDINCLYSKGVIKKNYLPPKGQVFISGLARSGSTILLEALYSSNKFISQTYRDMPFVVAPNLWKTISGGFIVKKEKEKRSHGDDIYINYDSPEAFEEIFWKLFSKKDYIKEDRLLIQEIDSDLFNKYKKFIKNILIQNNNKRYLVKNNNNLIRLKSLHKEFPDASFVIPFRNPLDQASSLLLQDKKFKKIHKEDKFALKYMNWLGHFEFGKNFKPFLFNKDSLPKNKEELDDINYWLRYWISVYNYILEKYGDFAIFIDHDNLCKNPKETFKLLSDKIKIKKETLNNFIPEIRPAHNYKKQNFNQELYKKSEKLYKKIKSHSLNSN